MMEKNFPFMHRLSDFIERTKYTLQRMDPENARCAAAREKLLHVLSGQMDMCAGNPDNLDGLLEIHGIFKSLREVFLLLKCLDRKNDPECRQLDQLLRECIALIAQSITSMNMLEKERLRRLN